AAGRAPENLRSGSERVVSPVLTRRSWQNNLLGSMLPDLSLFGPLLDSPEFGRLLESVRGGSPASIGGLVESSKALVLYLLQALTGRRVLLVVPDEARLDEYGRDLASFARLSGGEAAVSRILRFPALC